MATQTPKGLVATGNCYEDSATELMDNPAFNGWTLVHGRPTLQIPPYVEYGHAWLEDPSGEIVWDPGVKSELPKVLYYAFGRINPRDCYRYDAKQMKKKVVEFGHWGAWEGPDSTPPIPDEEIGEEAEEEEL